MVRSYQFCSRAVSTVCLTLMFLGNGLATNRQFDDVLGKLTVALPRAIRRVDRCRSVCEIYNTMGTVGRGECSKYVKVNKGLKMFVAVGCWILRCVKKSAIAQNLGWRRFQDGCKVCIANTKWKTASSERFKLFVLNIYIPERCLQMTCRACTLMKNEEWTHKREEIKSNFFPGQSNIKEFYQSPCLKINMIVVKSEMKDALLKIQQLTSETSSSPVAQSICAIFNLSGRRKRHQPDPTPAEEMPNSTKNSTVPRRSSGKPKTGEQYVASTIALSGVLVLILLLIGLGIFVLMRRHDRSSIVEQTTDIEATTMPGDTNELSEGRNI